MIEDTLDWFRKEEGWSWKDPSIDYSEAIIVELFHGTQGTFILKGTELGHYSELDRAFRSHQWFHAFGMAPEAIWLRKTASHCWLLMEKGEGVPAFHYSEKEQLGNILGNCLRRIHSLPVGKFFDQDHNMIVLMEQSNLTPEFPLSWDLVVSHGDFCLPNVLIDHDGQTQIIDLGDAGVYDRHYDLYWGIWSLRFNHFEDQIPNFLSSYGLSQLDEEKFFFIQKLCGH